MDSVYNNSIQWICQEMSKILKSVVTEEVACYLLDMDSVGDLEEYIKDILNYKEPGIQQFLKQLCILWNQVNHIDSDLKEVQKAANENHNNLIPTKNKISSSNKETNKMEESNTSGKKKIIYSPLFGANGKEKDVARLPGRNICECQCQKHALVANCLECGRVICDQEGAGPCFFCGFMVNHKNGDNIIKNTNEILEINETSNKCPNKLIEEKIGQKTNKIKKKGKIKNTNDLDMDEKSITKEFKEEIVKKSDGFAILGEKLLIGDKNSILEGQDNKLGSKKLSEENKELLDKALEFKNRLLEFDRNSIRRTKVIDDEMDYFQTDHSKWFSQGEKEVIKKMEEEIHDIRFASKLAPRQCTFDFAGRKLFEQDPFEKSQQLIEEKHTKFEQNDTLFQKENFPPKEINNFYRKDALIKPMFIVDDKDESFKSFSYGLKTGLNRIQDTEIQMINDQGLALSMHQPWASLLISGVKRHEGRTWYTTHRGPLWIVSTSQKPTTLEIKQVELQYKLSYDDKDLLLPNTYPCSCLLGRVDVVDCLSQEEYRIKHPDGESSSPYVFICENQIELKVKFPMKGKHKIYKLDSKLHKGAMKSLNWNTDI